MVKNKKYHYVYRITEISTMMHYYGDRSSDVLPINDLGVKYFSSFGNKYFQIDQKTNPKNYRYKIVKMFSSRKEANCYERRLHLRFDVKSHKSFINRGVQSSENFCTSGTNHSRNKGKDNPMYGLTRKTHSKQMIGNKNSFYGKSHTKQTLQILSDNARGFVTCKNIKTGRYLRVAKEDFEKNCELVGTTKGIKSTEETKTKISKTTKGVKTGPFKKLECPHCKRIIGINVITRFHMDNCKMKLNYL